MQMSSAQVNLAGTFSCPSLLLLKLFPGSPKNWAHRLTHRFPRADIMNLKFLCLPKFSCWPEWGTPAEEKSACPCGFFYGLRRTVTPCLPVLLPLPVATFCLPKRWGRKGKLKLYLELTAKRKAKEKNTYGRSEVECHGDNIHHKNYDKP